MNQRLNSKNFLITIFSIFVLWSCMSPIKEENSLTISTSSGVSQGLLSKNVITWEDIPYAIPPVGNLRWKAPRSLISPELLAHPLKPNIVS